jgi:two-component sensor histidine kinase
VKNNFQTILAMLSMHRTRLSADGANLLEKLGDAIQAMSLAHDQLSPSQTGFAVALSGYLRAQAANMQRTVENAVIEVMADELSVSIEQAVPIGLIVNELVTNSVKYAFGKEGGIIRVELMAAVSPGMAKLVVRDNGRGMGAQKSQGTGLTLVRALATQIRGQFEQESSSSGTVTSLSFPTRPV